MTKNQARASLKKIVEKLENALSDLEDLKNEVEETKDNIEPYEGKEELTTEQEERQEWFEDLFSVLDTAYDNIEEQREELESNTY